jgi:hypothetical protein
VDPDPALVAAAVAGLVDGPARLAVGLVEHRGVTVGADRPGRTAQRAGLGQVAVVGRLGLVGLVGEPAVARAVVDGLAAHDAQRELGVGVAPVVELGLVRFVPRLPRRIAPPAHADVGVVGHDVTVEHPSPNPSDLQERSPLLGRAMQPLVAGAAPGLGHRVGAGLDAALGGPGVRATVGMLAAGVAHFERVHGVGVERLAAAAPGTADRMVAAHGGGEPDVALLVRLAHVVDAVTGGGHRFAPCLGSRPSADQGPSVAPLHRPVAGGRGQAGGGGLDQRGRLVTSANAAGGRWLAPQLGRGNAPGAPARTGVHEP